MLRGKQTWTHLVETSTVTEHRVRSPCFHFSSRAPSPSPARPEASVFLRFRGPSSPRSRRTERSCVQHVWQNGIAKADEDLLICAAEFQFSLLTSAGVCVCFCVPAGSMSDRADEEVRGERSRAARQQQQLQRGEAATAMAPASLPSPQITPGQSWSSWADAVKLHGGDGEWRNKHTRSARQLAEGWAARHSGIDSSDPGNRSSPENVLSVTL
ncbi:hypothetical protein AOLI_G00251440 [Acnodon oligacanthus]